MKKNAKRIIAALLASVMLFTDCASGVAAEMQTDMEQNELEIPEGNPESGLAEEMQEEFSQEASENEEQPYVLFEVEELREQASKQYRLSDGTILAAQYGMDVHYENEDGEWAEIDNRFLYEAAESTEDFDGYKSAEGAVEFKFAPQVQEGELVKITHEDYEVGFELLPPAGKNNAEDADVFEETAEVEMENLKDDMFLALEESEVMELEEDSMELSPAPISFLQGEVLNAEEVPAELAAVPAVMSLEDEPEVVWADVSPGTPAEEDAQLFEDMKAEEAVTSVGYGNVLPGVSLQYVLSGSSLKEYILVNERSDSYSYGFAMNLENLEPQMQEDGSILLKDAESGTAVYEIPAGYMTDAAGEFSDAVTMSVAESEDGEWILNVTADAEWVNAEERVFPVQIDPTLNKLQESAANMRGCYAEKANPEMENENPGNLKVGYDTDIQEARIYIQFKNLPQLPKNSVICNSAFYFDVVSVSPWEGKILYILAQKVEGNLSWDYKFTWEDQPEVDTAVMDYQKIQYSNTNSKYIGWDITELVKEHYSATDAATRISTFAMIGQRETGTDADSRAKVKLCMFRSSGYPLLSITYRDTKGIEGYFTYQTHSAGNAGTAYVSDYTGQLTVVKPVGYYESTAMSYGLNLVYNSAYPNTYFSDNGTSIHSKNFANMKIAAGWKLSAQETITTVTLENVNSWGDSVTSTWLVYNDSDGTEHYFKQSSSNTSLYEDEDGLNLKITKNGNDFTMKDKQDNEKFFKNGYLTKLTDANGNRIHIIYNNGTATNNVPAGNGSDRITSISSQPAGEDTPVQIFKLTYNPSNYLTNVQETFSAATDAYRISRQIDHEVKNSIAYLKKIRNMVGTQEEESVRYGYTDGNCNLNYLLDAESGQGLHYAYIPTMTGYRISSFNAYSGDRTGNTVTVQSDEHRKTVYTDPGKSSATSDDVITTYLFNQCGQTVNVSTKDNTGKLLGVTASAYTTNSGTAKTNNRLVQGISVGQSGVNLLKNAGFEKTDAGTDPPQAAGWVEYMSNASGAIACRSDAPHSGTNQYNLYNSTTSESKIIYQTVMLQKDKTYTASAYVNTGRVQEFGADGAAFMKILDNNGGDIIAGNLLTYKLNEKIDGGWQRISVTYTPAETADYRICIHWRNARGTLRVDDMQLEEAEAPGSFNLVSNGSFEYGTTDWTVNSRAPEPAEEAKETQKTVSGSGAFVTKGEPGTALYASQTIPLNKSSDTTFLLSGFSKAASIASVEKTGENAGKKFWGITLAFTYADTSEPEVHSLPFSEYVRDWQYASMAVVPKRTGKTITSATIKCCYYNNANTARFDNISLTEEPAQTYSYDSEGNLTSVKSTGNGSDTYGYDTGTQNLLSVATEGSGTYSYTYRTSGNKHLPVTVKNDSVTMNISYTDRGEAKETKLTNTKDNQVMKSTASYSDGLLVSQTDQAGQKVDYTYTTQRDVCAITYANGQKIQTYKDLLWDRVENTYQSGKISVAYGYEKGMLESILRGGYITSGGEKQNQAYRFTYDDFGNRKTASVTNESGSEANVLATYTYSSDFENLERTTYGPENAATATVFYTYDLLDRVKSVTYDNDNEADVTYGYQYSSDGNLAGITVNGKKTYDYTYDSLGRLIYSAKLYYGSPVMFTSHEYDTSNRITGQSWQIGADAFSESYTYNQDDGTLTTMKIGENDTLGFNYNGLKQLIKRTSPNLDMTYVYQGRTDTSGSYTTNRVGEIRYTPKGSNAGTLPTLYYTYDPVGNITKIRSGSNAEEDTIASYVYDMQNQVTQEQAGERYSYYVYDSYGNIRSKTNSYPYASQSEVYTFSYENDSWKDQLSAVTYKAFNGTETTQELKYDAVGNPTEYFNGNKSWDFSWQNGRQLATATSGSTSITNTYDVDGIRDSKTVNGVRHDYVTLDGKVVRESYGNNTIDYFYDNDGRPYKIVVNEEGTIYTGYYVLNLQGDVIALVDETGCVQVTYTYDAWGKTRSSAKSENIGGKLCAYNALRYRGYYYDVDLGLYYLNSRFYDPEISRFINADSGISGNGEELLGYNMFAYCFNNPINLSDENGNWGALRTIIRKAVAIIKTVIRHVENFQNKKRIKREIQDSYTKAEAQKEINVILKKYSDNKNTCQVNFDVGPGVEIENSHKVGSKYDRQKVCMIIENADVTERKSSNMAAEWMLHNVAYDLSTPFVSIPWFFDKHDSAISANLDYDRDYRDSVVIMSKLLEIWGVQ